MSLTNQINEDLKSAMRAKDQAKLRALRAIKSAVLLAEREKGAGGELSDEAAMKLLQKLVKQRKESMDIYKEQGRDELYQKEKEEVEVIESYLPEQMDEQALEEALRPIIEDAGASSMQDMGKVMGIATKKLSGKADGKMIAEVVKRLLSA